MDRDFIKHAESVLCKQDSVLGVLIRKQKLVTRKRPSDYFAALCRSIVGQQVSVAAASAIFGRLEKITNLEPKLMLALSEEQIKQIGLSKQKTGYITDLARHFADNPEVYSHLETQSDEAVIKELTDVRGIGTWTAQMFLMFTLQRPDIFAPDDAGLQRAMMNLYGWEVLPPKKQLEEKALVWQPYRTVACLHLWQSLDNEPLKP